MEKTPKSKRHTKLRRKKLTEETKCGLKESAPPKKEITGTPKAHSTPLDTKKVASTSGTVECEDVDNEDKYLDDSPVLNDSWNPCRVVWDYEAEADYIKLPPDKKIVPNRGKFQKQGIFWFIEKHVFNKKRKRSHANLAQKLAVQKKPVAQRKLNMNSQQQFYIKYSPRRKYNLKKLQQLQASSTNDLLSFLSVELQTLQKTEVQNTCTAPGSSCNEVVASDNSGNDTSNNSEDVTTNNRKDITSGYSNKVIEVEDNTYSNVVQPVEDCGRKTNTDRKQANETFSALFNDDDDICIVQCTQEIEEKINKDEYNTNRENSELHLVNSMKDSYIAGDVRPNRRKLDRNSPLQVKYKCKKIEVKTKNNRANRSSPFRLKENSKDIETKKRPEVDFNKYYVRIKSVTPKRSSRNVAYSSSDSVNMVSDCDKLSTDLVVNNPKCLPGNDAFDDSFDAVIKNFTEDDIEKLSQGVSVEKDINCVSAPKTTLKASDGQFCENSVLNHCTTAYQVQSKRKNVNSNRRTVLDIASSSNNEFNVKISSRKCGNSYVSPCPNIVPSNTSNKLQLNRGQKKDQEHTLDRANLVNSVVMLSSNTVLDTPPSSEVPKSPRKCSQEEIEKKKYEARKRLERKKLSEKDNTYNHSKHTGTDIRKLKVPDNEESRMFKCTSYNNNQNEVSSHLLYNISEIERKRQIAKMKLEKTRALDIKNNYLKH